MLRKGHLQGPHVLRTRSCTDNRSEAKLQYEEQRRPYSSARLILVWVGFGRHVDPDLGRQPEVVSPT